MGERAHTPGPWYTSRKPGSNRMRINAPGWGHLAKVVVRMSGSIGDCEDGLANARLIAAAPDLLEALKDARYALYGNGAGNPKIDAAIAKAEGRS
jgi:hypothetical protein